MRNFFMINNNNNNNSNKPNTIEGGERGLVPRKVIGDLFSDLRETFANVHGSVLLLIERGSLLEDLEKKSETLAARGAILNPTPPLWRRMFETGLDWVKCAWYWMCATAFCRALKGDPSMDRPLKILK